MNDIPPKNSAKKTAKKATKRAKKTATKNPVGRPKTKDDTKDIKSALQDIAGGSSTRQALAKHKVRRETFYQLQTESEELRTLYARAREGQAQHYADKLLDIAQSVLDGTLDPQAARAAADIIKWTAARILPHTYSEKKTIDINLDKGDPVQAMFDRAKTLDNAEIIDIS